MEVWHVLFYCLIIFRWHIAYNIPDIAIQDMAYIIQSFCRELYYVSDDGVYCGIL